MICCVPWSWNYRPRSFSGRECMADWFGSERGSFAAKHFTVKRIMCFFLARFDGRFIDIYGYIICVLQVSGATCMIFAIMSDSYLIDVGFFEKRLKRSQQRSRPCINEYPIYFITIDTQFYFVKIHKTLYVANILGVVLFSRRFNQHHYTSVS